VQCRKEHLYKESSLALKTELKSQSRPPQFVSMSFDQIRAILLLVQAYFGSFGNIKQQAKKLKNKKIKNPRNLADS
jgi:hypothetical protein